jgi:hypothetical protein
MILLLFLLFTMMFEIVRGTEFMKSSVGLEYCGLGYWILTIIYIGLALLAVKAFC